MPGSAAAAVEMTETQQSIFNAPAPGSNTGNTAAPPSASHGLPAKPVSGAAQAANGADDASRGLKRSREDEEQEDESDEDVAMEEDSDDE